MWQKCTFVKVYSDISLESIKEYSRCHGWNIIGICLLAPTHTFMLLFTRSPNNILQLWAINTHDGGNHEHVQQFDEIVSTQQQWQSTTPSYFIPKTNVLTPTIIYVSLQNQQPNPNFDLVTLIWRWNETTSSIGWRTFVTLTKDLLINQFPYHIWNMLNLKQHQWLFDKKQHINMAPSQPN